MWSVWTRGVDHLKYKLKYVSERGSLRPSKLKHFLVYSTGNSFRANSALGGEKGLDLELLEKKITKSSTSQAYKELQIYV